MLPWSLASNLRIHEVPAGGTEPETFTFYFECVLQLLLQSTYCCTPYASCMYTVCIQLRIICIEYAYDDFVWTPLSMALSIWWSSAQKIAGQTGCCRTSWYCWHATFDIGHYILEHVKSFSGLLNSVRVRLLECRIVCIGLRAGGCVYFLKAVLYDADQAHIKLDKASVEKIYSLIFC